MPLQGTINSKYTELSVYSVKIVLVIVTLLLFQRIFLFHVQFVNGMNTSHVQFRRKPAS